MIVVLIEYSFYTLARGVESTKRKDVLRYLEKQSAPDLSHDPLSCSPPADESKAGLALKLEKTSTQVYCCFYSINSFCNGYFLRLLLTCECLLLLQPECYFSFSLLQDHPESIMLHCTIQLMFYFSKCFTYVCLSVAEATVSGAQVKESWHWTYSYPTMTHDPLTRSAFNELWGGAVPKRVS